MFPKYRFKFEMFVAACWSYGKWGRSIIWSDVPLVDCSMVNILILSPPISRPQVFLAKKIDEYGLIYGCYFPFYML